MTDTVAPTANFIRNRIARDMEDGVVDRVVTRFPPEPSGFLHIGHAKAALLNFSIAREFGGLFKLRFDDTNPVRESARFERQMISDLSWLGICWHGQPHYTSDYFPKLYDFARQLVNKGLAYVCELDAIQLRETRGTLTAAGSDSPWRDRAVASSLELLEEMRCGQFADGKLVLRAKIDMKSPNLNMRDPVLYRILNVSHHRSGNDWHIYPTYDFAHCLSDALEGITHSLCTLEFEDHRPLYDWLLQSLDIQSPPQQIEFARLNLQGVVTSKRLLAAAIDAGLADGWDDPRLPTLAGLRRRGCSVESLHDFCQRIGVSRAANEVSAAQLEFCVRNVLEKKAARAMAVLRPLEVRLEQWPEGQRQTLSLPRFPDDPDRGYRTLTLSDRLWIDRDDFAMQPPKGWRRLSPGKTVRLRGACVIRCEAVDCDEHGQPTLLHCSCDLNTLGRKPDYKIGGVIHWLSAEDARPAILRLYPSWSTMAEAGEDSLATIPVTDCDQALIEAELVTATAGELRQFERLGWFCLDSIRGRDSLPVWNRTIPLRAGWRPPGTPQA